MSYIIENTSESRLEAEELPFSLNFSFKPLFDFWEKLAAKEGSTVDSLAVPFLDELKKHAHLKEPFQDVKILEEHEPLLRKLFYPLFPDLTTNNEIRMVGLPFHPVWFNVTQRFKSIIAAAHGPDNITIRAGGVDMLYRNACVWILNVIYGANINFSKTMSIEIPNMDTGIVRHYRIHFNADFSTIKTNEDTIPLNEADIAELISKFDDVEFWKEKMPPNSYDFEGFAIWKLFDVTREEAQSSLRYHLLNKNALQSSEKLEQIKRNIRSILNLSEIKIGFASYDKEMKVLSSMGVGFWDDEDAFRHEISQPDCFCEHSHATLFEEKKMVIVPQYNEKKSETNPLIKRLVKNDLKSYIATPILHEDEMIGVLELASGTEGELNAPVANMLKNLIPIFTTALKRSQDEMENQLEAIVQDKFTAIHPSVSWRFFEAAGRFWQNNLLYDSNEMEPIVFPEIYPLYGQSDIKGSSTERNIAIQADMVEQLNSAKSVMELTIKSFPLPIYKKMKFRIDKCIDLMSEGLGAGDEIKVMDFMKTEVYPIFQHIEKLQPDLKRAVEAYNEELDDELHIVYKKRKDYEQSVRAINENISDYIEAAQRDAQKMFPHYFEKYQTDGVEHNMYIGASMVKNKEFNEVYLRNLRLWQLLITCEVENVVYNLQSELPVPLRVASLILIHSNPITINFRTEEKRFDVDGAYNIRYEIIKNRIDKAMVKGHSERLTQAGKIAIIYSQAKEAEEYRGYLEYLQAINYIDSEIEDLELQDMQGVTGMKALRVKVIYHQDQDLPVESKKIMAEK